MLECSRVDAAPRVWRPLSGKFCWDGPLGALNSVALFMNFRQGFLVVELPGIGYRLSSIRLVTYVVKLLSGNLMPTDGMRGSIAPRPQLYPVLTTKSHRKTLPSFAHITHTSCTHHRRTCFSHTHTPTPSQVSISYTRSHVP